MAEPPVGTRTWRGISGRHYACAVIPIIETIPAPARFLIALAVRRLDNGIALLVAARLFTSVCAEAARSAWSAWAKAKGAGEIHLHDLPGADADPHAALADLEH